MPTFVAAIAAAAGHYCTLEITPALVSSCQPNFQTNAHRGMEKVTPVHYHIFFFQHRAAACYNLTFTAAAMLMIPKKYPLVKTL